MWSTRSMRWGRWAWHGARTERRAQSCEVLSFESQPEDTVKHRSLGCSVGLISNPSVLAQGRRLRRITNPSYGRSLTRSRNEQAPAICSGLVRFEWTEWATSSKNDTCTGLRSGFLIVMRIAFLDRFLFREQRKSTPRGRKHSQRSRSHH